MNQGQAIRRHWSPEGVMNNERGIDDEWCLVEPKLDLSYNKYYEGLLAHGSGHVSVRGCFEEGWGGEPQDVEYIRMPANVTLEKPVSMKSKFGTYVPGITGNHPLLNNEIVNLPWFLDIRLYFEDEPLDMELSDIDAYARWLDMRDSTLHRRLRWKTRAGAVIDVLFSRFVSLDTRNLSVQRVEVLYAADESGRSRRRDGKLRIEAGIDARVRTNGHNHFNSIDTKRDDDDIIGLTVTTDAGNVVSFASSLSADREVDWEVVDEGERAYYCGESRLDGQGSVSVTKLSAVSTDRDTPHTDCVTILRNHIGKSPDELYRSHRRLWDGRWRMCDIEIEGDPEAQKAMRFSIYHLLRSHVENDSRVGICAKGYAGEAYFGRYFWDTEIHMLPFFIFTNPDAARTLLEFRYNTLPGARRNARNYGYRGARYPWESSIDGTEQCPSRQYADNQIHVTADIVYGIWHYYCVSGDEEFLLTRGLEIMVETSRYWIERVDYDDKGTANLLGVMGPDEYLPFTRNNAYTNYLVRFTLRRTLETLEKLERSKDSDTKAYNAIVEKLGIEPEEIRHFSEIADAIPVPVDSKRDLLLQCEDFESYANIDFDTIWLDRSRPFGQFISQEKNYRSKSLKQADVLQLMSLFPGEFSPKQIEVAYDYYEPITTHDSSLSASTHSVIASWLGRTDEAYRFFRGAAEGIHIANCGGLWIALVRGFLGLTNPMYAVVPDINPMLPPHWDRVELKVVWGGEVYRIEATQSSKKVERIHEVDLH